MTKTEARLRTGLALVVLLLLAGRFLPGVWTWGINHLAYLPGWFAAAWTIAAALALWPALCRRFAGALGDSIPRFLFGSRGGPVVVILVSGLLFFVLGRHSHFLGDATWLGSFIKEGRPFHYFNFFDYHLHFRLYNLLGGKVSGYVLYQASSILAGMLALVLQFALLRRLPWEPWRRAAALAFLFLYPPIALYFGYIESYAAPFALLTAFLLTGLLVLDGRAPLWLASLLFGLALALQLGSVFSAPGLLVLVMRTPHLRLRARWIQGLGPAGGCFVLAVLLYLAAGYNVSWFRREFLETQFGRSMFVSWRGDHGLFSLYHWKDLANLALITAPVALVVILVQARRIRQEIRRPEIAFLVVQVAAVAFCRVFLEAKLGGAKDWDLVAAHAAGLPLLAAMLLPAGDERAWPAPSPQHTPVPGGPRAGGASPLVVQAIGVALLTTAPWIALPNFEDRAITRVIDVTADAPDWVRAYHLEDLGKFYRDRDDLPRADRLYTKCAQISPMHARLHVQLGWIRYREGRKELAEESYRAAARLDSTLAVAASMLGRLAAERGDLPEARRQFARWTRLEPSSFAAWRSLGEAAFQMEDWPAAVQALDRATRETPDDQAFGVLGLSLLQLGRFAESAQAFRAALKLRDGAVENRIGLSWALIKAAGAGQALTSEARAAWLAEARNTVQTLRREHPEDTEIQALGRELEAIR